MDGQTDRQTTVNQNHREAVLDFNRLIFEFQLCGCRVSRVGKYDIYENIEMPKI